MSENKIRKYVNCAMRAAERLMFLVSLPNNLSVGIICQYLIVNIAANALNSSLLLLYVYLFQSGYNKVMLVKQTGLKT